MPSCPGDKQFLIVVTEFFTNNRLLDVAVFLAVRGIAEAYSHQLSKPQDTTVWRVVEFGWAILDYWAMILAWSQT